MRADVLTGLPTKQGVGSSNLSGRIKSSENTGASANAEGTTLQLAEDERVDAGDAPFLENFKSPTTQRVEGMRYFCPSQRRVGHKCSLL